MTELRINSLSFSLGSMTVRFSDQGEIFLPLSHFPRLAGANPSDLSQWVLIGHGLGVHWPTLDEDLSVENILWAIRLSPARG
jgi:hypothetical protein